MDGDAYREALHKALRRLETSDRFESEVRTALQSYDSEVVEAVVSELRAKRYLNDSRIARQVAESNVGRRAMGDAMLREKLERRGAPESEIESALETSLSEEARIDGILQAKYSPSDDPAKAGRYLYSRGYSEDAIESALSRFFGERE